MDPTLFTLRSPVAQTDRRILTLMTCGLGFAGRERLATNERLLNGLDIPVVPSLLFAGKGGRAVLIQGALSPLALRKVFARLP